MNTNTLRINVAGKGKQTRLANRELLALIHEGHDVNEVAAAFAIAPDTVVTRLSRMGYDRHGTPLPTTETPTRERVVEWDRDDDAWQHQAECRTGGHDPDMWHPSSAEERATVGRAAKAICSGCPVASKCLNMAMRAEGTLHAKYRAGIFGGLDEEQRAALAHRRVA